MKITCISAAVSLFATAMATCAYAKGPAVFDSDRHLRGPGRGGSNRGGPNQGSRPLGGGRPGGSQRGKPNKDGSWGGHGGRPSGSDFGPPVEEDFEAICAGFNCTEVLSTGNCPQPGSHGYQNHTHGHGDHDILVNHTEGDRAEKRLACWCCRNNTNENNSDIIKPLRDNHHKKGRLGGRPAGVRPGGRPRGHGGLHPSDAEKDEICIDFNCTEVLTGQDCDFPRRDGNNRTRHHPDHEEGMNHTQGFKEKRLACWCCNNRTGSIPNNRP